MEMPGEIVFPPDTKMRLSSVVIRMRLTIHACDAHGLCSVQISLTAFRYDVVLCLILQFNKQNLKKGFALPCVVIPTSKCTYNI